MALNPAIARTAGPRTHHKLAYYVCVVHPAESAEMQSPQPQDETEHPSAW